MTIISYSKIGETNMGYLEDYEKVYLDLESQKQLRFSDINDITYEENSSVIESLS